MNSQDLTNGDREPKGGKTRWPWFGITLGACAALASVYSYLRLSDEGPKWPAGFEELVRASCTSLISLDGHRSLEFSYDHHVDLLETNPSKEADERKTAGQWNYDPDSRRYAITLDGKTVGYSVVSPGSNDRCMLVAGDISAVDLRSTWFSVDNSDDYESPERERDAP